MIDTHLSTVQLQELREELQQQLERRSRHLLGLRAEASDGTGADAQYQELLVDLAAADRAIAELTQALDRVAEGTYGRCSECEAGIPFERLKIRPLARFCITCQRRYEAA
ncbi:MULTISPECIES: TraR/DksA family transcriptional regulator [Nonomuraea]|jgi:DnaK suppressor protein|uniref:TraR/DksA family transcriptional regulator n=1 Tax=Nonomuraea salmonea TaxID=46181 RepID=A0ABV5NTV1_9ACTN